ncbi:Gfo/Idh/MocA family protein [Edaphobacter flagellatus]|uniref:Gfo/Idh/MocA family protein n=1 Tax=Edaphobacter flagellatus TaxID=1933044 RepID=UPI0021B28F9B|nr:Gfo/Idh/MocA family oxidoreductase [Edaphobacter flagellatus]
MSNLSRRRFIQASSAAAAFSGTLRVLAAPQNEARILGPNDQINVALIGAGIRGQSDMSTALQVPNTKLVAVADCYDGRLTHSKELWGSDVFTTRDYREVLARKDIDAVVIATPDHWHKQAAVDAMNAGKDVYLEKPMIHVYPDGPVIIDAAKKTNRILQVGSQRVSSILYAKTKELLASGAIGQLNMVSARWDRSSAQGAWNYTVPPDASTETCDWPRFLGSAPKVAWNGERFFQWRKWSDYGSGVAGDLFVHLFSGTHFITGATGPTRAMATGGLRYWKDGRNVPDVLLALFDYPQGFNLSLRVNFVSGGDDSEGFLFTGSDGSIEISSAGVTLTRSPMSKAPGYTVNTFSNAMQKEALADYHRKYPENREDATTTAGVERFVAPKGYNDTYSHFENFFHSVRTRQQPVEDATFGFRAAGAALLANQSMERGKIVEWNPDTMRLG